MNTISGEYTPVESLLEQSRGGQVDEATKKDLALRKVCSDFESVLTSAFLKEGMKSAKELSKCDEDEEDSGSESYMDMAHEQIAEFIGSQGMMGIGKVLYESMKSRLDNAKQNH
eukprot:TRINITY_DN9688_c0_g2_i1.p6 TRINITY_DN9688_c0_g2~~TRINITY_DN9688_c0_g2_i1.p6  ORF type:complete len:114 (-),score=29.27 TRINITY_DN9688_c0_g2_i1:600-941(-)